MERIKRFVQYAAFAASSAVLFNTSGHAADVPYPGHAVTMIASFPAGQATDVAARLLAEEMAKEWKAPIVVQNQTGGLGVPAMLALKNAAADGYTLGVGTTGTMATNTYLLENAPYDPLKDFRLVAPFFTAPLVIIVNQAAPFQTLPELLASARKEPGSVTWGIPGAGSAQHVAGELLFERAGVTMQRVPYRGSGAAIQDLIGGRIMLMTDSLSATLPLIESGKVKALAVTTARRVSQLPNVPTVAETGFPGYSAYGWGGILAPADTPDAVVEKVADTIRTVMDRNTFQTRLESRALIADLRSAEEWKDFVQSQISQIAGLLAKAGVPRQ